MVFTFEMIFLTVEMNLLLLLLLLLNWLGWTGWLGLVGWLVGWMEHDYAHAREEEEEEERKD